MKLDEFLNGLLNLCGGKAWLERMRQLLKGQSRLFLHALKNHLRYAIQHKQRHTLGSHKHLPFAEGNEMGVFRAEVEVHCNFPRSRSSFLYWLIGSFFQRLNHPITQ